MSRIRKREAGVIWLKMDLLSIDTRASRARRRRSLASIKCHMKCRKNRRNYNGIGFLALRVAAAAFVDNTKLVFLDKSQRASKLFCPPFPSAARRTEPANVFSARPPILMRYRILFSEQPSIPCAPSFLFVL